MSKVELNQERGQIDDAYFDDAELTDILENVRFQIHQDRDATLSSNHYTKVQANERIATAIDSHEANEMANAIQDAIVNVASNEMVNNELSLYPVKSELKPIVDNSKNTYLQSSTYESNKAIYATDAYLSERLPRGSIIMWNGSSVPSGWALCNGGHGTPNLSGRFIVAYGNGYGIGNTGGTNHITITTAQMPTHKHGASSNNKLGDHNHGGTSSSNETDSHSHTGTITSGGVAHNHGSVWGTQSHAHNHSVSLNNESVSHGHTMSAFQHRHQGIYTQFGKEVNNDDFNNDGGTGPSWQGGVGDNGYYVTGAAGGHAHSLDGATTNHTHPFTTGNESAAHTHTPTLNNATSTHNHALSNVSTHSKTHDHALTITSESMAHNHTITINNTGGGQSYDNRPPYYALAFIMKL